MAAPTNRVTRRVLADFGEDAELVLAELQDVPETLAGAERQDPERIQAALVLGAASSLERFSALLDLGRLDFRDLLMTAGLGPEGWPNVLERELGKQ